MLHVPRLLLQLVALRLVLLALLEDFESFGLDGGFAGAVTHLGEFGLVGGEFSVEFSELYIDRFDARVDLKRVSDVQYASIGMPGCNSSRISHLILRY